MPGWTKAVLVYEIAAQPNVVPDTLRVKTEAVILVNGEKDLIGFDVATDVTDVQDDLGVPTVVRTLTLTLNAQFNSNLQDGADPAAFFQNLYTISLQQALSARVTARPPLVT